MDHQEERAPGSCDLKDPTPDNPDQDFKGAFQDSEVEDKKDSGNIADHKPFLAAGLKVFPCKLDEGPLLDYSVPVVLQEIIGGKAHSEQLDKLLSPSRKILASGSPASPFKLHRAGIPGSSFVTPEEYMRTRAEQRASQQRSNPVSQQGDKISATETLLSPVLRKPISRGTLRNSEAPPESVSNQGLSADRLTRQAQPRETSIFVRREKFPGKSESGLIPGTEDMFPSPLRLEEISTSRSDNLDDFSKLIESKLTAKRPLLSVMVHKNVARPACTFRNYYAQVQIETEEKEVHRVEFLKLQQELSQSTCPSFKPDVSLQESPKSYVGFAVLQSTHPHSPILPGSAGGIDRIEDLFDAPRESVSMVSEVCLDELMQISRPEFGSVKMVTDDPASHVPNNFMISRVAETAATNPIQLRQVSPTQHNRPNAYQITTGLEELLDLKIADLSNRPSARKLNLHSKCSPEPALSSRIIIPQDYAGTSTNMVDNLDKLAQNNPKPYPVVRPRSGLLGGASKDQSNPENPAQLQPILVSNTPDNMAKQPHRYQTRRRVLKMLLSDIVTNSVTSAQQPNISVGASRVGPVEDQNIKVCLPDGFECEFSHCDSLASGALRRGIDYPRLNLQPAVPFVKPVDKVCPGECLTPTSRVSYRYTRKRRKSTQAMYSEQVEMKLTKSKSKARTAFLGKHRSDQDPGSNADAGEQREPAKLRKLVNSRTGHSVKCNCYKCKPGSEFLRPRPASAKKKVKKKDGEKPMMLLGLDEILGGSRSSCRSTSIHQQYKLPLANISFQLRTPSRTQRPREASPTVSLEGAGAGQMGSDEGTEGRLGMRLEEVLELKERLNKETSPMPVRAVSISGTISIGSLEVPRDPSPSIVSCESRPTH